MEINVKLLSKNEEAPFDLLLLADPYEKLVKNYLEKWKCFIACVNEEIVGEFLLIEKNKDAIEIINIAVKEKFQGKGIGKELILIAIDKAKELKYKIIEIGTGNSSIKQLYLYQKCGFRIEEIDFDFFRKNYKEPIYEDGIECRDKIRLRMHLDD